MGYQKLDQWKIDQLPFRDKIIGVNRPPSNLIEAIHWREQQNKVTLIAVCGDRGTGKSNTAIVLAKLFDKSFNLKERLFFRIEDYLKFLRDVKISKKHIWCVLDEAGYDLDSQKWYSKMALTFKYLTEMGRISKVSLIVTLPHFYALNKATRNLTNIFIIMTRVGYGRLYVVDTGSYSAVVNGDAIMSKWLDIVVEHAEPAMWQEYEDMKFAFWKEFLEKNMLKLEEQTDKKLKGNSKPIDNSIITVAREEKLGYIAIRKRFGLSDYMARKYHELALLPIEPTTTPINNDSNIISKKQKL